MKPHLARLGVLMVLAMLALPGAARADSVTQDSVTQWSETAANALLRDAGQGAYGLPQMAMVHGAMFDAANSIDQPLPPLHRRAARQALVLLRRRGRRRRAPRPGRRRHGAA